MEALDELLTTYKDAPSRWHAVKALVESLWPWAQYLGVTARKWPNILGQTFYEYLDLGPLGAVWTDGPKSCWMWEP